MDKELLNEYYIDNRGQDSLVVHVPSIVLIDITQFSGLLKLRVGNELVTYELSKEQGNRLISYLEKGK